MVHEGAQRSSYTKYLPPVLWSAETDPLQLLSRCLCIFEQILTRMPVAAHQATLVSASETHIELTSVAAAQLFRPYDLVTISTTDRDGEQATEQVQIRQVEETQLSLLTPLKRTYQSGTVTLTDYASLEAAIDAIPQLFNPWQTPARFLPWLASWVALSLQENWSEYQRRKFVAEMMSIYQQRGLKQGLLTYLDIYAATEANPRIAIDDGEAIFRAAWTPQQTLQLHAVAYSHTVMGQAVLLHPSAIAIDTTDHYIVADRGGQEQRVPRQTWPPALWRLSNTGEVPYRDSRPQPIYTGDQLRNPVAVVVDSTDNRDQYYVLIKGDQTRRFPPAIYRFTLANNALTAEPVVVISGIDWVTEPVDMGLDISQANGKRLVVLDRGDPFDSDLPPRLILLTLDGRSVEQRLLPRAAVEEPTALAVAADGTVLVADARDPQSRAPADVLRISLQTEESPISLLGELPVTDNPLIFPTGLVWKDNHTAIVSDSGVRGSESSSERTLAEAAALYQINLSTSPPQIQRLSQTRRLVRPSKIALDRHRQLIIADSGEAHPRREWRARPNEFGIVVLFSQQRDTSSERRNQIRFEIEQVVNDQKPGHTAWWMNSV